MGGYAARDANNAQLTPRSPRPGGGIGRAVRGGSGSRSIDVLPRNDWANPKTGAAVRPMSMTLVLSHPVPFWEEKST